MLLDTKQIAAAREAAPSVAVEDAGHPFVSIVIPVKNDADRLERCLASLARQDYPAERLEIIVVDNGSTDRSREVAEQGGAQVSCFPELRVGALRNRGVSQSRGEILAFVDSDHETPPAWVSSAVYELSRLAEIAMVGSPCLAPLNGTWVQRCWEIHRLRNCKSREVTWLGAGNMFIRRADFERVGGFDEQLVATEDVDLCIRLGAANGRMVSDVRLANVHHGEPPTLWAFFRKELWRGSSGLKAFWSQGMPLRELPSLAYPVYQLIAMVATLAAVVLLLLGYGVPPLAFSTLCLILPALALGIKTAWQTRRFWAAPPLAVLYFVYGLARVGSLFRG